MKTRKFLIFAALLPLLLLLAGCGEKQAFNPVVFVAEHSADSLTNAAGERLQGDPELGFDNDATTMEFGELYATQLYITCRKSIMCRREQRVRRRRAPTLRKPFFLLK